MAKAPSVFSQRVLLTSETRPSLHPLATVIHDARNKLAPVVIGLEERSKADSGNECCNPLELLVADIRQKTHALQKRIGNGREEDKGQLAKELLSMYGRLGPFVDQIPDDKEEQFIVPRETYRQAVTEFDMLIGRGISLLQTKPLPEEQPVTGDISEYLADIVSDYKRHYPEVVFEIHIKQGLTADFQPHRLKRALENLINNAIQALPETGGTISVTLESRHIDPEERPFSEIREGGYISIEIADNGSGIPQDILSRLSHSSLTTKENGSGCGLVSAGKSLIHHQGHLYIESEEGAGTRVTALIPSMSPAAPEA